MLCNYHTVKSIIAKLPLIKSITHDIQSMWNKIIEKRDEFSIAQCNNKSSGKKTKNEESIKEELSVLVDKINGYIKEIEDLNGVAVGLKDGIMHFPILHDGIAACICIQPIDNGTIYYHYLDEDCVNRKQYNGV